MTVKHNQDIINLMRLVEGRDYKFAGEPEQKPGDQVRGTDTADTDGKDHPFKNRLVGEDTTLEDILSKKYSNFKDIQQKEKQEDKEDLDKESSEKNSEVQMEATYNPLDDERAEQRYMDSEVRRFRQRELQHELRHEINNVAVSIVKYYLKNAQDRKFKDRETGRVVTFDNEARAKSVADKLKFGGPWRVSFQPVWEVVIPGDSEFSPRAMRRGESMAAGLRERARSRGKTIEVFVMLTSAEPTTQPRTYEIVEAANPAQQAAIAIAMKKAGKKPKSESVEEEKQRLDPKCWTGYRKAGTKMKGGVRVNNCVKVEDQGVAEGLPGSLSKSDYTPGKTVKHTSSNCTTCHGRKSMYKVGGKLFPDNKQGATKVKCPTCKGTGDKQGVAEGIFDFKKQPMPEHGDELKIGDRYVIFDDGGSHYGVSWIKQDRSEAYEEFNKSEYTNLNQLKKAIWDEIKYQDQRGVAEGKKPDRYHIVGKDGKPADLASYADKASAIKDRDEKYPGAVVQQVGPRGKVKGVAEAGPFSYGKAPRKGSVADLAAKKRREQERGKQPIEPKDQQVGVAKVTEGTGGDIQQAFQNLGAGVSDASLAKGIEYILKGRHQEGENWLRSKKIPSEIITQLKTIKVNPNANLEQYINDKLIPYVKNKMSSGSQQSQNTQTTSSNYSIGISDEVAAKKIASKLMGMPVTQQNVSSYVKRYLSMVGRTEKDLPQLSALVIDELNKKGVAEGENRIAAGINQSIKQKLIKKLLARDPELERNYLELASIDELKQMLKDLQEGRSCRMKEAVPQPATKPTPTGTAPQTNQPPTKPGQPTAGSISPDEQQALDKIATNPAMKQQFDKLLGQAQPAKPAGPMTLDPDQEAALEKLKANAGLKTQYDKLIKQANPAA